MNWSNWIRQSHRWLSMAFTVAVIVNIVAIALKKYTNPVGLLAVIPLALQFFTGHLGDFRVTASLRAWLCNK